MKYCKKCKIAAAETATVCAKCGSPVSIFGAAKPSSEPAKPSTARPAAAPPTPPMPGATPPPSFATKPAPSFAAKPAVSTTMFTLTGEVQRLETERKKNLRRGRGLGLLSLLIALAIVVIIYQVYASTVLVYAVLDNIKYEQDPVAENQLTISFDVKTPGKVAFDRRSGKGHTEKIDRIANTEGHKTVWAWPSDPKTGIDLSVVSRGGWFLTSEQKHFDVTRDGIGVDVVFLIDITNSMGPYIDVLKKQCIAFADEVNRQGLDCQLGLIGFADVEYNEPILTFDLSTPKKFQENVASLELSNGVDPPESSVEALEKALEMKLRPHTRVCFVHITDAACHNTDRIPAVAKILKDRKIITYVVSQNRQRALYKPLCVNKGEFYDLRGESSFAAILKELAKSIANTIKSD